MRIAALLIIAACGPGTRTGNDTPDGGGVDVAHGPDSGPPVDNGCGGLPNCYSVYAHSDGTLYEIDLATKALQTIGPFKAPGSDPITDLAVAPDGTIWTISETQLYTASATDGHVTAKGSLSACGKRGVALTFTPDGKLYEGDFEGAICQIDLSGAQPVVGAPVMLDHGMALSGDIVAVGNGTVFGTLYALADKTDAGTNLSNVLGTIDLATGAVTKIGATGFPKLFGTSFANGKVIGFTHADGGKVVAIDPTTGVGTDYATFIDPATNMGISFAGAGVNALVPIIQ